MFFSPAVRCIWSEQIVLLENDQSFTNAVFSVANVSDFSVDFLCTGGGTADSVWFRRLPVFSLLPSPFVWTATSYNPSTGLARIFSEYMRTAENQVDGVVFLQCVRGGLPATVDFRPGKSSCVGGSYNCWLSSFSVNFVSHRSISRNHFTICKFNLNLCLSCSPTANL